MITVARGLRLQVPLVARFSRPELLRANDLCANQIALVAVNFGRVHFLLQRPLNPIGYLPLRIRMEKDGRRVLWSLVVFLPVLLRWIVEREEVLAEILEFCF